MKKLMKAKFLVVYIAVFSFAGVMCKSSKGTDESKTNVEAGKEQAVTTGDAKVNEKGQQIFEKNACLSCHLPDVDQLARGMGPSIAMMSKAYKENGGKSALLAFLDGNDKPIVAPKKYKMMKPNLTRLKKLSAQEKSDLADYMLSF
jgi:cytochrome c551/c552